MALIRLDKLLADNGVGTRSEVKSLIQRGKIYIDDVVCRDSGFKLDPTGKVIKVDGKVLKIGEKYIYLMMNKPEGVISATTDKNEKTVIDLLSDEYKKKGLFPVGRLDKDTVGLLILTNNGKFAHNTLSPRKHITKRYYAEIEGVLPENAIMLFEQGIELANGEKCTKSLLKVLHYGADCAKIELQIKEGKYHQVKRMFAALNCRVSFLERVGFDELELDRALLRGEYRPLNEREMEVVKKFIDETECD